MSRVVMSVAAVGVATAVAGVAATQPASISAPLVDLAALIVVGSSTHPDGTGNENFFQGMFDAPPYNTGGNLEHVNFFTGPFGINQALQAHDGEPNAVLSSGWGAANASLLLTHLQAAKDPALPQTLFILDNNVARPSSGFGTMYPWFAMIGVTAADTTPSDKKTPATLEEKPKPLTNVVRESEKAEPQPENDEGTSSSTSDPVATVDKPKKDEKQETAQDEPKQSGADAEAGKS